MSLRSLKSILISTLCALGLAAGSAQAGPVDTFQGSLWQLSTNGIDLDANPLTQTFRILLSVDTSGYTGGGAYLDSVAIKVSSSVSGASLYSAPGGTSAWSLQAGGLNASGCSGSGSGFECAQTLTVTGGAAVPGGLFQWVFDITMNNGSLLTGTNLASVKGEYVDTSGNKVGDLTSEYVTLHTVPEPGSLLLLGLGLLAAGVAPRRRRA